MPEPRPAMPLRAASRASTLGLVVAIALSLFPPAASPTAALDVALDRAAPVATHDGGTKQPTAGGESPDLTGRVIVRYRDGATEADRGRARAAGALRLVEDLAFSNAELLEPTGGVVAQAIGRVVAHPAVLSATPEHRITVMGETAEPLFGQQWALHNTGQAVGEFAGVPDVDMNVPEAWAVTKGTSSVVVAVTDSGVDFSHAELAARAWTNPGEVAGNGLDDDDNGLTDDVNGWDFCNEDNGVFEPGSVHGTHVAGSIAASANGQGVAGIAPNVRIMAVRLFNDTVDACATEANAIEALNYAYAMGARIINASWGIYAGEPPPALQDAVASADDALIVAAAGNENNDNDGETPLFPASFDLPNVLSVAAIDKWGLLTTLTNFGVTTVDVAAPGEDILSTLPGGSYGLMSGTSMAAANASGVAALAASAREALLGDAPQLRQHLIATARALPSALSAIASPRLLDARAAVVDRPDIRRISGANRYATAAAISKATYTPSVPYVFVATGADFPDALAGGALAAQAGSPLLLVQQSSIPAPSLAEIQRLEPFQIVVLGSSGVISDTVLNQLNGLASDGAFRIFGANRYATAAAVSRSGWEDGANVANVFIATGLNFPDALAGVPASGALGGPLLLSATNSLPDATKAELQRLNPARVVILGSSGVVSNAVASAAATAAGAPVVRWAGANRFATAATVAANSFGPLAETAFVANGLNFPDALAGGPAGGAYGGPMLLTNPTSLPSETASALVARSPARIFVLGSSAVVSDGVVTQIDALFP